jgi:hypothetical protein
MSHTFPADTRFAEPYDAKDYGSPSITWKPPNTYNCGYGERAALWARPRGHTTIPYRSSQRAAMLR